MQWTDESGSAYGNDPYKSGYSHPYASGFGDEYGASTTTDTIAMPWSPEQLLPWPGQGQGQGHQECAAGAYYAEAAWESPGAEGHLATPAPEHVAPGHEPPSPDAPGGEAVQPVFVDLSGRRQRRVRRAARLLAIPACGYVTLLISSALGGPALDSSFVPLPDPPSPTAHPAAAVPDASPAPAHSTGTPTAAKHTRRVIAAVATRPNVPAAAPAATPAPAPAAALSSTTTPTRATTAKGRSHKPMK